MIDFSNCIQKNATDASTPVGVTTGEKKQHMNHYAGECNDLFDKNKINDDNHQNVNNDIASSAKSDETNYRGTVPCSGGDGPSMAWCIPLCSGDSCTISSRRFNHTSIIPPVLPSIHPSIHPCVHLSTHWPPIHPPPNDGSMSAQCHTPTTQVHPGAFPALGFNRSWEGYELRESAGPEGGIDHGPPRSCPRTDKGSFDLKSSMTNASNDHHPSPIRPSIHHPSISPSSPQSISQPACPTPPYVPADTSYDPSCS